MDESKFIAQYAPYLIPLVAMVVLVVFIKKTLFVGMMSNETYKQQMEREILVLTHYQAMTEKLNGMLELQREVVGQAGEIIKALHDLSHDLRDGQRTEKETAGRSTP